MKRQHKIKVLLADDHALVREGLRSSLIRHPSIAVVGEAVNGKDALRKAKQLSPDVILMDLNMPEMSGLEATPLVRRTCPRTRVIALTVHDNKEYVFQILRTGANGYVLKDTSPEELVRAIEAVARNGAFFSPAISSILLEEVVHGTIERAPSPERTLSQREKEVLDSIAKGSTSKEIASSLRLSVRTVETYRVRIKRKLRARNTAEMLSSARAQHLL